MFYQLNKEIKLPQDSQAPIFKFLTPILIGTIGTITVMYLSFISSNFERMNVKFDSFLDKFSVMDKRVDRLEYRVYDDKNNNGGVVNK